MYREAYFRCLSTTDCGSLLPDEDTMINKEYESVYGNPRLPDNLKEMIGNNIAKVVEEDPR